MPWSAIGLVGSAVTLVAFIAALAAWSYRRRLEQTEILLKSAPPADRLRALESVIATVRVDTSTLSDVQKYDLALRLLAERTNNTRTMAMLVVSIAILAAVVAIVALLHGPAGAPTDGSTTLPAQKTPTSPAQRDTPLPTPRTTHVAAQTTSDKDDSAERALILTDLTEAYLATGRKLAVFEDWGRPPARQTLRVNQGTLTVAFTDGRVVSMSVDPKLLPTPSHYNASLAHASRLARAEAIEVALFFSTYNQFREALVSLTATPTDFNLSFIDATAFAREAVNRGHAALCAMGGTPPRMFPAGGFAEPIPPGCSTSTFP